MGNLDSGLQMTEVHPRMVSTATVSRYLEGLDFPATKQDIIEYAEDQNAPPDLLDVLHRMAEPADREYYCMAGIWDAIEEAE